MFVCLLFCLVKIFKSPDRKYGRYAGFEGGIWRRFWIGSQICLNFWARTKIDWDSDILHYFSVYLNGLGFFPVNFLSLVKRTIILVIFFSKFLIILANSFENWPIFPWKTESWPFSSKFSMFSRYFSKKGFYCVSKWQFFQISSQISNFCPPNRKWRLLLCF